MRGMKRDARPWMAYAPALSRPSPLATYHAISSSDSARTSTAVVSTRLTSYAPCLRLTPVRTSWRLPDSRRSIAADSPAPAPPRVAAPASRRVLGRAAGGGRPARAARGRVALRTVRAALVLLPLAHPLPTPQGRLAGTGPVALLLDSGWPASREWSRQQ